VHLLEAGPAPRDLLADKGFSGRAFAAELAAGRTAVLVPPDKKQRAVMPPSLLKVIAEWRNRIETSLSRSATTRPAPGAQVQRHCPRAPDVRKSAPPSRATAQLSKRSVLARPGRPRQGSEDNGGLSDARPVLGRWRRDGHASTSATGRPGPGARVHPGARGPRRRQGSAGERHRVTSASRDCPDGTGRFGTRRDLKAAWPGETRTALDWLRRPGRPISACGESVNGVVLSYANRPILPPGGVAGGSMGECES
jgi:hypothetical protein